MVRIFHALSRVTRGFSSLFTDRKRVPLFSTISPVTVAKCCVVHQRNYPFQGPSTGSLNKIRKVCTKHFNFLTKLAKSNKVSRYLFPFYIHPITTLLNHTFLGCLLLLFFSAPFNRLLYPTFLTFSHLRNIADKKNVS